MTVLGVIAASASISLPLLLAAGYGERAWWACPYAVIAAAVAANSRSS